MNLVSLTLFVLALAMISDAFKSLGYTLIGETSKFKSWNTRDTKSIYFMTISESNWGDAWFNCRVNLKGHLLSIESEEENFFIRQLQIKYNIQTIWTSGAFDSNSNAWRWVSTGAEMIFTDWNSNQPIRNDSDARVLISNGLFHSFWDTAPMSSFLHSVCEIKIGETTTTTTTTLPTTSEMMSTVTTQSTASEITTTVTTTNPTTTQSTTSEMTSTASTSNPTTTPIFVCPSDGHFPDAYDCTKYYICILHEGELHRRHCTCPPTSHWNQDLLNCDIGECPDPTTTEMTITPLSTTTINSSEFVCRAIGYFPAPEDPCHQYYRCYLLGSVFIYYKHKCGDGYTWSQSLNLCIRGPCDNLSPYTCV